jgi:F-type H+-transporting ATPase subunit gamma
MLTKGLIEINRG